MKKRILSGLLVAVLLVSMIVVPAYAQEQTETETPVGYCQHCKEVIPQEQWLPWDEGNTGPRTGHYYLAEDIIAQSSQITINLDDDLLRNEICLDLRGRTYTVTGLRPFLIYGIFSIMDSVGDGEIAVTGASNAHGAFAMMSKSANSKDGAGELNIYSGTLRRINDAAHQVSYGGLIYISSGATLNVHGGKLIGGEVYAHKISKTVYDPYGGTIYASNSYVNIYGGTVTGGVAYNTVVEGTKREAYGGNIYACDGSVLTVAGGVIENGYSDIYGGNIAVKNASMVMTGGTVKGGYSAGASGNIQVSTSNGGKASFKMSGGVIRDGVCATTGGNLRVNNTTVSLDISGGEIYGDVYVKLFESFKLSGSPKIYMGKAHGLKLVYDSNYASKLDISGLTQEAEIYLDGDPHVFTEGNAQAYLNCFKGAIRSDVTVDENGALQLVSSTSGYCPHCWETGNKVTWTAFDNSAPSTNVTVTSGHYYLTDAVTRTRLLIINAGIDYVLDMAGKTYTCSSYKFANLYGKLSLLDSQGLGVITGTGHAGANGGVIMGSANCEFRMYSGTLSRKLNAGEEGKRIYNGGVLYAPTAAVKIYGGTIKGGRAAVAYKANGCKGGNIYCTGSFEMTAGALIGGTAVTNTMYDSNGSGTMVEHTAIMTGVGGNLYIQNGTAQISGGHIIGGSAGNGGNLYVNSASTMNITGGVIRDGGCSMPIGNNNGGNLYITGGAEKSIENTLIRGGSVGNTEAEKYSYGGNIYLTSCTLAVTNSVIAEGKAGLVSTDAGRGGNLYGSGTSVWNFRHSVVSAGEATHHGGNLFAPGGTCVSVYSGLFSGGEAGTYGGNLYCSGLNLYSGRVVGGVAGTNGGNVYVYTGETNYANAVADNDPNTPAPVIALGSSGKLGGNIFVGVSADCAIEGAEIYGGVGDTASSNSLFDGDNVYASESTTLSVKDTVIYGIVADKSSGNGIYAGGALTLSGNTVVLNEEKKSCVYIGSTGALTVAADFTGEAAVAFEDSHFTNVTEPQGGSVAAKNTAADVFTGKLYLEGYNGRDYGLPAVFAEPNDPTLYVANTSVTDMTTGETLWYRETQSAVDAASQNAYVKLFASANTLQITRDLTVDINGNSLSISGSGTVYGFDSANDDYEGYGIVTATGVTVAPALLAPNGNQYVTVTNEEGTSFHRMGVHVSNVALRPSVAGIYFHSVWACDSLLQAKIKSYGVAVSTQNMPGADFAADLDTMYTSEASDTFVSGKSQPSVLIANILKPGADNGNRGNIEIYATSYVVIDDGTEQGLPLVIEDNGNGGVAYSLRKVMEKVDLVWPKLTENQQTAMKALYNLAPEAMDTWEVYNLAASVKGTASVRPLKILTLGHSLAVDSAHMLNMVAAAEGYDQELLIGTLYYSGCPLYKHVNYLTQDAAVYQLYLSSTLTPNKAPVIYKGYSMKMGIEYTDWDIIIMQGGVFEIAEDATYQDGKIQIIQDYVNRYKTNPDAIFAWHMPWACPTDNDLRDQYPYSPNTYYTNYTKYNDDRSVLYNAITGAVGRNIVTDNSFVYLIPSGTAIENALSSYLTEKDLHRDYVHTSDLGRLIAAYTWYCTLTGVDHLDDIAVDAIPKAFLKSTADQTKDYVLSDAEKRIVIESVNNALANPLEMTQSQYTEAP